MSQTRFSGPIVSTAGFKPGASTVALTLVAKGSVAVNPASIADNDIGVTDVTISGAAVGDIVLMCPPTAGLTAGLMAGVPHVSATDTVKLPIANLSGGAVDEASASWSYMILRFA
jgi:hypothetical protein